MAADGQVVFEITADGKHAIASIKDITKAIEAEGKKWDKSAEQSTSGIENAFSGMVKNVATMFSAAKIGQAILEWGSNALQIASDLSEVQNVVDTVFGDGANQIEAWAQNAGRQFGLTELQAKKFTSTLGAMMKSSGLAGDEIVSMSTDLAGLAADMASFYNLDFETAFEKIRSGISGETMPLKQLGINMSVANLEAFALAQGLEKTFSEMDQGEQTMLRYQYLMQATADAQGDFNKTAEGFENTKRRITTAIDTINASAGKFIQETLNPLTSGIAKFLEDIASNGQRERTVLDDYNEIEVDTAEKMADLEATYDKAKSIIDVLKKIEEGTVQLKDGSTIAFSELFRNIGDIENEGGDVRGYLESLGVDVDYVITEYAKWKEETKRLASVVPELTSAIDKETGSIDGNTDSLQKNLDEWKANEEKKLAWTAYYAQARALEEKKASMYLYELDYMGAEQAVKNQVDKINQLYQKYGIDPNRGTDKLIRVTEGYKIETDDLRILNGEIMKLEELRTEESDALNTLNEQTTDYSEAEEKLANKKQALIEKYGEEGQAAQDAAEATDYLGKSTEEWVKALKGAPEAADAIKAVTDYYKGVRDATEQAVNSTVKGFEKITTAWDQRSDLANKETEALNKYTQVWQKWGSDNAALKKMKEYVDNGGKLTKVELEAYEALVKVRNAQKELNDEMSQYRPEGMQSALQSQLKFMQDYIQNLDTLKEWGLSDEMLASLSDGSKESAQFLQGLVEGGPEAAAAVDELYQTVNAEKQKFTSQLTDQKLVADQTFSSLVETAKEAMEGLDLGGEAAEAVGNTVLGIASGISSNVGAVSSAVTELLNALNPLSVLGFNWGFSDGSFILELPNIPGFATGLDYVPNDNFPAFLHEGEAVLTAEENRIWQTFKNGRQPGMDYDALGGVMRDNIRTGGDVYLDGRTVGHVISDQQGKSYRNLQRSGWQG